MITYSFKIEFISADKDIKNVFKDHQASFKVHAYMSYSGLFISRC